VKPYFERLQERTVIEYKDQVGTARVSNDIRKIMPAAYYGQIDSLFVAIDQDLWGQFDPISNIIHVHKEARFRDDDLLDEAAAQTILHGGAVYAVEQAKIPGESMVAAVFRY